MASDAHRRTTLPLLTAADPPPVTVVNPEGRSPFLLIGDHAGNVIPSQLGTLGLGAADRERHIAWDIGVAGLGVRLAEALDASFVRQTYSRLVVDCNRRPDAPDAVPAVSDATVVPGNFDLPDSERSRRIVEVHEPYQEAIAAAIASRLAAGRPIIVIALHSFTPALADGVRRPWHIGILHDRGDSRFARALLGVLRGDGALEVGDNEPYRMDLIDYTIPRHCYAANLRYAEIEVRQDLIQSHEGQVAWTSLLARLLAQALR